LWGACGRSPAAVGNGGKHGILRRDDIAPARAGNEGRTGMSRCGLFGLAALLATAVAAQAQTPAERGGYLVNTIMTCNNCHTPMGPNGPQFDKALSGGLRFNEPPFDVTASNITPDPETGIGKWSEADIKKSLQEGVRPNGAHLAEVMPTGFYKILTPGDLVGIVAYLRSLPPIKNKVPDPVYKMQIPHQVFPGAEKAMSQADLDDKVKRGFYLVTIGHCLECHTPFGPPGSGVDFQNSIGKGGREFKGPWGVSVSRNITSSKDKGLGDWSDADIKRAISQGVRKDGTRLKPPMGYPYYAKMTDGDVDAVVAYLRTLPAKE
jgi:mono/diheme cytochrome c family protein